MFKEWLFEPLDTLFFRSGLSLDKGEPGWLESIFPPTPLTMQGVVRSVIILSHCSDPEKFGRNECDTCNDKCPLPEAIGTPQEGEYGNLNIYGPCLIKDNKTYYPAPLDLMKEKNGSNRLFALRPSGNPIHCDLGNVHLPAKPDDLDCEGFDAAGGWIEEGALQRYLKNSKNVPDIEEKELLANDKFFKKEPKVGIARESDTHKVKEGMLYSIVPLRFENNVKIRLRVDGSSSNLELKGFATKIGGEGKVCKLNINEENCSAPQEISLKKGDKFTLVLLQPADFNENQLRWLPGKFQQKVNSKGATHWEGTIEEGDLKKIKVSLVSACIGKPQKIGGWDLVKKRVKPMKSYVPAGSVYFFEVIEVIGDGESSTLQSEGKIGLNTQIGFGHYFLGRWQ